MTRPYSKNRPSTLIAPAAVKAGLNSRPARIVLSDTTGPSDCTKQAERFNPRVLTVRGAVMGRAAAKSQNDNVHGARMNVIPLAYRIEDAAAAMGVGKSKVWELIAEGALVARKIGSATIIRHTDLEAFIASLPLADATKRAQSSSK